MKIHCLQQPPYETRSFPLVDKDYDRMVQEVPDTHREIKTNYRAQDTGDDVLAKSETQESVDSESTESAIGKNNVEYRKPGLELLGTFHDSLINNANLLQSIQSDQKYDRKRQSYFFS